MKYKLTSIVKFPIRNSSPLIMLNIKRGIAIFGSAGSGKTESGFVPILKHAGKCGDN